jgi:hypothetical protein
VDGTRKRKWAETGFVKNNYVCKWQKKEKRTRKKVGDKIGGDGG